MTEALSFGVDPKLATLLGSSYKSTEQAIKELVDNAWDADAQQVDIVLPDGMTSDCIVIADNGSGMTVEELKKEYLKVARDRRSTKGDLTVGRRRRVKGRKGIGKFAGLMIAEQMELTTRVRGRQATIVFDRTKLLDAQSDFEKIKFPLTVQECPESEHGTTVTLRDLNRRLTHPDADKLRRILLSDYGRAVEFTVLVNGQKATLQDIPGEYHTFDEPLPTVGNVILSFTLSDGKERMKDSGIVVKVNGKPVGEPSFFGLDKQEDIPQELLKRVYGEIEADGLLDDVTADWGYVIENSRAFQEMEQYVQGVVRIELEKTFKREFNLLHARIKQQIDSRLSKLPEHKKAYAQAALERVINKFYGDSEDRIQAVVSVLLDALERDEYWEIVKAIHASEHNDVQAFADALTAFGLLEIVLVGKQAKSRLDVLDSFDKLISNALTLEKQVHQVLEYNLWILGSEHALMSSNRTMKKVVEQYTGAKYVGDNATRRPDILLLAALDGRYLMIELKRPDKRIDRDDENQAQKYRDELSVKLNPMSIMLVGGSIDPALRANPGKDIRYHSYTDICSRARGEVAWLLQSLAEDKDIRLA
jgi:hypothetical protein